MTTKLISGLTANTVPDTADVFPHTDVSDTSEAATGTTKKTTGANLTKAISAMVGDSGSGGTKGLVPAPASGDAAAGKFLKADGTWTTVGSGSLADDSVTNAKLANVATATFKGRTTAGTGDPEDLTATQATALLNAMVGDSGSGGTKGLVPAPASGDAAAAKFLKADGTWVAPSGTGAPSTATYITQVAESGLSAEQALAALATGMLKVTTTTGVLSTATPGSDYISPTTQTAIIQVACSDESTALTAGTNKIKFRMPKAMTVTAVRASLSTVQISGSIFTVDINEGGTTILSTKLTVDNTEATSTTAATPPVISDAALADDAEISIDIDQVGDGTAAGLKVSLIGTWA